MTRTAGIVVFVVVVALSVKFALHLVYGWRPAPRVDAVAISDDDLAVLRQAAAGLDRDAWPEGVGW